MIPCTSRRNLVVTPWTAELPTAMLRTAMALAVAVLPLAGCERPAGPPQPPSEVVVRTAVAAARTIERSRSYPGVTASVRPVVLSARVQGFLEQQKVADGSVVKVGDVVYTIDQRPFEDALAEAQANLDAAVAQRDLAASDVERNRKLLPSGAVSPERFDKLEAQLKEAEAQVAGQTAAVNNARLNLSYCTVSSPLVGLLGASQAFEGSMVGPGFTTELNTVVQLDPMWAQFSPSTPEWPELQALLGKGPVKATVRYGGPADDASPGDSGISAEGHVVFTDNSASSSTSTIMFRVEFPNPEGIFRPGTYVDVEVDLGPMPDVIMIPQDAVFARETELMVWVVNPDWTAKSVRVEVAQREGDDVAVRSGLSVGDRVVVAGGQKLRNGSKVKEQATAAPAPGAAGGSAARPATGGTTPAPTRPASSQPASQPASHPAGSGSPSTRSTPAVAPPAGSSSPGAPAAVPASAGPASSGAGSSSGSTSSGTRGGFGSIPANRPPSDQGDPGPAKGDSGPAKGDSGPAKGDSGPAKGDSGPAGPPKAAPGASPPSTSSPGGSAPGAATPSRTSPGGLSGKGSSSRSRSFDAVAVSSSR